jgi:hypothetical protein
MNLASNTALTALDAAVQCGRHPTQRRVLHMQLDIDQDLPGVGFIPVPIKVLGGYAELYDQISGQILRLDLTALFPP